MDHYHGNCSFKYFSFRSHEIPNAKPQEGCMKGQVWRCYINEDSERAYLRWCLDKLPAIKVGFHLDDF